MPLHGGKLLICGGYWDGRIFLIATEHDQPLETYHHHAEAVTVIVPDKKEELLITGTSIA